MKNVLGVFLLILIISCSNYHGLYNKNNSLIYNVKDFGANGDGKTDNWAALQNLIDKLSNGQGGVIYFPKGTYIIKDKTLLVWGNNLQLVGESKDETILIKKGVAGWWGELIAIGGKTNGGKYFGGFGNLPYDRFLIYKGRSLPANNVSINNFTFKTVGPSNSKNANNMGVFNSSNISISNCLFLDAPQTNLAIINDTQKHQNSNILVSDSEFMRSNNHNVRVISYNQGDKLSNNVVFQNCHFSNVIELDRSKELMGKKVHLWYRAGLGNSLISLIVKSSHFDATADVVSTVNSSNLTIEKSVINGTLELHNNRRYLDGTISLCENTFGREIIISNKDTLIFKSNHFRGDKERVYLSNVANLIK